MEKKFKELNSAHEVLSDPDKRKKYDQYGANWEQVEAYEHARRQAGARGESGPENSFGGEGFSDIFENLFKGRGRAGSGRGFAMQGEDLETEVQLTLAEVFTGVTKRMTLQEPVPCSTCHGTEPFVDEPVQPVRGTVRRCRPIRSKYESPPGCRMGRGFAWPARDKPAPTAASPATCTCA
jgi:DnaJ-class molecular chaperone